MSEADILPLKGVIPRSSRAVRMSDFSGVPATVSSINDARAPVWYDVAVAHHYDGTIQTWVRAVDIESPENRAKIAIALRQAADGLDQPYGHDPELDRGVDLPEKAPA